MFNYHDYYFNKDNRGPEQVWPGKTIDGYSFVGNHAPYMKQEEYENIPVKADAHTRLLDLFKEEDLKFYNDIVDQCAKKKSVIRKEMEPQHQPEGQWLLLLQWLDIYGYMPESQNPFPAN
jgi:hypothetical protein